jgi:hypothetical protein
MINLPRRNRTAHAVKKQQWDAPFNATRHGHFLPTDLSH